jgi:hypothetical protein
MLAEEVPACPEGQSGSGPLSGFACRCSAGMWSCGIRSQGASVARCIAGDGGK